MNSPHNHSLDIHVKETIRNRIDMVQFIGRYLKLRQSGKSLKGLCPFHKERSPSFTVDPSRGVYHCFGCGKGGDIFSFLMEMEGLSFPESIDRLAQEAGIALDRSQWTGTVRNGTDITKQEAIEIHRWAMMFYYEQMKKNQTVIEYLKKRGIKPETARQFKLGYAPKGWTALGTGAGTAGISSDRLLQSGLSVASSQGSKPYDRFRDRIIFPIFDISGRPIAFAGRSCDDESMPKYLNSPETILYQKNRLLYGLHAARPYINETGKLIIVEGYMDFLILFQEGIRNVVASAGTALSAEHGHCIRRFTHTVIFVFDGDDAGYEAAERGALVLAPFGLDIRICMLPMGEDPDTYCTKFGTAGFNALVDNAEEALLFMIGRAVRRFDVKTAAGVSAAVDFLLQLVCLTSDTVIRSSYLKRIAERFDIKEQALAAALQSKESSPHSATVFDAGTRSTPKEFLMTQEGHFLHMLFKAPDLIKKAQQYIFAEFFLQSVSRKLYSLMIDTYAHDPLLHSILDHSDDPQIHSIVSLMMIFDFSAGDYEEELSHKIKRFLLQQYTRRKHAVTMEIKKTSDTSLRLRLLQKQKEIITQYGAINKEW